MAYRVKVKRKDVEHQCCFKNGRGHTGNELFDFLTVYHKKTNEDGDGTKEYFRRTMSSFSLSISQYYLKGSKNQDGQ